MHVVEAKMLTGYALLPSTSHGMHIIILLSLCPMLWFEKKKRKKNQFKVVKDDFLRRFPPPEIRVCLTIETLIVR